MSWIKASPPVTPINQKTSSTCWYACLQMLFIWKGKDPAEILQKLNADPDIFPDYLMTNGVAPSDCPGIARCLGLQPVGDGSLDAGVLARAIHNHGPYWVAGEWIKGSPHVKVVTGVNVEAGLVKLINPWNNYDLSEDEDLFDNFNNRGPIWGNAFGSAMYWSS